MQHGIFFFFFFFFFFWEKVVKRSDCKIYTLTQYVLCDYVIHIYDCPCKCPSAYWRAMGSLSAPWLADDLVPLMAMMVDLRREKLSLHLIQLMVLL